MASPSLFNSDPDPRREAPALRMEAIKHEIDFQKAILASLQDSPETLDSCELEVMAQLQLIALEEQLARAQGLPVPDPHSSRMSMSDQPSGSTDRKRKFHNFASSLHHGSDLTSKRPTPSSSPFLAASAPSAPSSLPGRSESTYIDLTGDDDDDVGTFQSTTMVHRSTTPGELSWSRQSRPGHANNADWPPKPKPTAMVHRSATSGEFSWSHQSRPEHANNGRSATPGGLSWSRQSRPGHANNVDWPPGPQPTTMVHRPATSGELSWSQSRPEYANNGRSTTPGELSWSRQSRPGHANNADWPVGPQPTTVVHRPATSGNFSWSRQSRPGHANNADWPLGPQPTTMVRRPATPGELSWSRQSRPGHANNADWSPGPQPTTMAHRSATNLSNGAYNMPFPSQQSLNPLRSIINRTADPGYVNPAHRLLDDYGEVDAEKSEQEIKDLLSSIRPDQEIPAEQRVGTPDALRYPLYAHQQLALQWMKSMEEGANKGGILADDMGLGKTVSTLSLIVSRPSEDRKNKTNLIIGPVALIRQWRAEIKTKLKGSHALSVFLLHGKKRSFKDLCDYDIVLTTYGTIAQEWKRHERYIADHPGQDPDNSPELARACPILHSKSKWYRVILDEAQCIKNKDTQSAKAAHQIVATYRWCLTGTPMMNSVSDLYPLFQFLRIKPYMDHKKFNEDFGCLAPNKREGPVERDRALQKLRAVLKATMLRRMKDSKLDGKPILNLPPKYEVVVHVVFSEDESSVYQGLEQQSRIEFSKYLRANAVQKNISHILVMILRLRQAACHPHLIDDFDMVVIETLVEEMLALAGEMLPEVVARIKAKGASFDCPICFDAVLNPVFVLPCGHNLCPACLLQLQTNATQNNLRNGRESEGFVACVECRQPVNLKNVIDYDTFIRVHMPEEAAERGLATEGVDDDDTDDDDDSDSDSDSDDDGNVGSGLRAGPKNAGIADDADEKGNLKGFVLSSSDDDPDFEDLGTVLDRCPKPSKMETKGFVPSLFDDDSDLEDLETIFARPPRLSKMETKPGEPESKEPRKPKMETKPGKPERKEPRKLKKQKGKKKAEEVKPHMLKALRKDSRKNKAARRRYMHYLRDNWQPSAKVTKACEIVMSLRHTEEKIIIFSVFTGLLDLLEVQMKYQLAINYCRYDGGMSATQRDEATRKFTDNPRVKVMLVSLKAGNAGLNLTAASHVILMDPFWNPFVEMQAVDRAHRIGQQRPVTVHRLLVQGTVEDRIVKLQEQKRSLVNAALDEGASKTLGRLSTEDLCMIFGFSS